MFEALGRLKACSTVAGGKDAAGGSRHRMGVASSPLPCRRHETVRQAAAGLRRRRCVRGSFCWRQRSRTTRARCRPALPGYSAGRLPVRLEPWEEPSGHPGICDASRLIRLPGFSPGRTHNEHDRKAKTASPIRSDRRCRWFRWSPRVWFAAWSTWLDSSSNRSPRPPDQPSHNGSRLAQLSA